jgi:hypothetical protein
MAGPLLSDRVYETSATTGTGTFTLAGTTSGSVTFSSGVGNGNTCFYCAAHQTANEWEVGFGTVSTGPDQLARTTVLRSTNSNSAVNFSAGTKDVFVIAPADYGLPLIQMPTTFAVRRMLETRFSSVVGNARGNGANDFQPYRQTATQVASGNYSSVLGGTRNTASGGNSVVCGGNSNTASGTRSGVFTGASNTANTTNSAVLSGGNNSATQNYSVCCGGYGNNAGGGTYTGIVAGTSNSSSSARSFIGAGNSNFCNGGNSSVVGGNNNDATGTNSIVGGGNTNVASATSSFIGAGESNTASGTQSVVCGGGGNVANTNYAAILGGHQGKASLRAQQAHASGRFAADGDAQTSQLVARISTTNATPTELRLEGSSVRITIVTDTTWAFHILLVARRTDADNESAAYEFLGCIDRNGSTTALVGTVQKTVIAEDTAAWDADVTADDTNDAMAITVTGEASKTIRWVAYIRLVEVTG